MNWEGLFAAVLALILLYFLYNNIKHKPEAFSKENLKKSSYSLGLLALALIGLVMFCVLILQS